MSTKDQFIDMAQRGMLYFHVRCVSNGEVYFRFESRTIMAIS